METFEIGTEYEATCGTQKSRLVIVDNFYKGQSAFVVEVAAKINSGKLKGQFREFKRDIAFSVKEGADKWMTEITC